MKQIILILSILMILSSCYKSDDIVEPSQTPTPSGPIIRTLTASLCANSFCVDGMNAGQIIQANQGDTVMVYASCNPAVITVFGVGSFEYYGYLGNQGFYTYYFIVP